MQNDPIRAAYIRVTSITDEEFVFSVRVVSYPVPRTRHSEVKELDNNEIYSDKQCWSNLLDGKVFYNEEFCFHTWYIDCENSSLV